MGEPLGLEQTCVVKLVDRAAVIDKLVYTAANPVRDHLVDRVVHWPGVNGLGALLAGRSLCATRAPCTSSGRTAQCPTNSSCRSPSPPNSDPTTAVVSELRERVRAIELACGRTSAHWASRAGSARRARSVLARFSGEHGAPAEPVTVFVRPSSGTGAAAAAERWTRLAAPGLLSKPPLIGRPRHLGGLGPALPVSSRWRVSQLRTEAKSGSGQLSSKICQLSVHRSRAEQARAGMSGRARLEPNPIDVRSSLYGRFGTCVRP